MKDRLGRDITYLRISLTNQCNLNCGYCRREGECHQKTELTPSWVICAVKAGAGLGIQHIRLTGGEPLLYKGLPELIRDIKAIPGIRRISLTTNGVLLSKMATDLKEAGLDDINVSLDAANAKEYEAITGKPFFEKVIEGIGAAKDAGMEVKLNAVAEEWTELVSLVKLAERMGVCLRFIELMPIGQGAQGKRFPADHILRKLEETFGSASVTKPTSLTGAGPAVYYRFRKLNQDVGIIGAVCTPFCHKCNRIRLRSDGVIQSCLGQDMGVKITDFSSQEQVMACMKEAIEKKPSGHEFGKKEVGKVARGMDEIGG